MQTLGAGAGRNTPYIFVAGIVIGSLLTALVVPFVANQSGDPDRRDELTAGAPREAEDLAARPGAPSSDDESSTTTVAGGADGRGASSTATSRADSAPSTDSAQAAEQRASSDQVSGAVLGATDVGVTAETVKIGFLLLDTGDLDRLGISVPGVDPKTQRQAFEAQLADINARGGLHGREAVGVYETFDVLSQDDMRRACLALRDREVFGVVAAGGFQGPAILCLTEEGGTPLVNQGNHGTPTEYIERSGGLLFSLYPRSDRVMSNWVAELERLGELAGKRIGIVSQEHANPGDTVVGGELVPALERLGYDVVHRSRFSADHSTAASQIPVEVQQMQTKDVDLVMLTASTLMSTQFVQTADGQGYEPAYTFTDWASMNNDTSNQAMPDSYDGTILITTYRTGEDKTGAGETPPEKVCREIYEEGTGQQMAPKGENEHGLLQGNCTALKAFELGAMTAGTELTRPAFSDGMQAIGSFPMTMWGGGSFGPDKYDAADFVRTARWYADCRCIKPTEDFRKSRF